VDQIVRGHGGEVTVETPRDRGGAEFVVALPSEREP
jgi:signal transduction histidine kinase